MKKSDIQALGTKKRRVLELSFQPALSEKRIRSVGLSALLAATWLLRFIICGVGLLAVSAMSFLIVLISPIAKISYAREVLAYKSLIRSLTHRVENLERVSPTAKEGQPAAHAHQQEQQVYANA